jgi:sterol desaturase/sphingolipid hydroxylase (fatty acid hydroxylase superfamily)
MEAATVLDVIRAEGIIRICAFVSVFVTLAAFELWSPRLERPELAGAYKSKRWITNLSMVLLSAAVLRLVLPVAAVGTAIIAQRNGWGILNLYQVNPIVSGVLSFIVLDFAVWTEHVASHKIPLLWRVHSMHHADTAIDVTTGLRFHPIEILLSMGWKMLVVALLGPPAVSVLVFEIVLNATAMFNHSNIKVPAGVDKVLRRLIVTPDMHRVHHSTDRRETDSNYGFNLPLWDRIFRTYKAQPHLGHEGMDIGLEQYRDKRPSNLLWSLRLPLL